MKLEKKAPLAQGNHSDDMVNCNNDCVNFEQDWLIKTVKMCLEQGYTAIPKKKGATYKDGEFYPLDEFTECKQQIFGIRLDNLILVDYDGNKPDKPCIPHNELITILGEPEPCLVQSNDLGDSLHYLYRLPDGIDRTTLKHSNDGWLDGVDLKTGNQLVDLQEHKIIINGQLPTFDQIPHAPQILIDALTTVNRETVKQANDYIRTSKQKAAELLSYIPANCDYSTWIKIGMALHDEFKGDEHGLDLWDQWSITGVTKEVYAGRTTIEYKWQTFGNYQGAPVTIATLFNIAKQAGADIAEINADFLEQEVMAEFDVIPEQERQSLFDDALLTRDLLESPPPKRKFIIDGFLPEHIIGVIAGAGGVGKSRLLLQMAIGLATGTNYLNLSVPEPKKVLILSGEDDRAEMINRLHNMINHINVFDEIIDLDLLSKNLLIKDFSSAELDYALTEKKNDKGAVKSQFQKQLKGELEQRPDIEVIIIDTYSRFNGGSENSNEDATQFIKACEELKIQNSKTILITAHTVKGTNQNDVNAVAGGKRFTDSARWAITLSKYALDGVKGKDLESFYSLDTTQQQEVFRQIQHTHVKNNYGPLIGSIYIELHNDGSAFDLRGNRFSIADFLNKHKAPRPVKAETEYEKIAPLIIETLKAEPVTKNKLGDKAGTNTKFDVSKSVLLKIVERMLKEGLLQYGSKSENGRGLLLEVIEQADF